MGPRSRATGGRTQESGATRTEYVVPSSISKENGLRIGQKSDGRDLKKSYVWLVSAAILALSASNSVVGQDGPGAWSVSISDENGEVQKITLSDKGGASIPILVENNGITSITVSLDCTSPFDAQVSCPGDVTVTAGENTTVYGVVSDVDVLNYAASTSELFEVTGTVIARQGVPIASSKRRYDTGGNQWTFTIKLLLGCGDGRLAISKCLATVWRYCKSPVWR